MQFIITKSRFIFNLLNVHGLLYGYLIKFAMCRYFVHDLIIGLNMSAFLLAYIVLISLLLSKLLLLLSRTRVPDSDSMPVLTGLDRDSMVRDL